MAESIITDELKSLIGVNGPETEAEVTTTGCRLFARSVGHEDLIFYDEEVAKARGYKSIVAPPGFLGTPIFKPADAKGAGAPPGGLNIPYKRILNGGTTYEYFEPIVAGDVILSSSRVTEFQEREGSVGPMLITYRETDFRRKSDGKVVAKGSSNMINY